MSDVVDLTALSRATIYRLIIAGTFPVPIKIAGASRWLASEVTAFIEDRMAERAERPDHG
jgi:predicted DNA-binding transcriptional regulator AlpA